MNYGVVTICRNSRSTIARTIASVLGQPRLPEQYVFVDGGSDDGTVAEIELALGRARADRPDVASVDVRVLNQVGEGIPAAWNLGIEALATDAVFLLNSDDWYDDCCSESVLTAFERNPETGIVVCPVRFWAPDASVGVVRHPKSTRLFPVLMPMLHPGCFVRRTVYEEVGLFDAQYRISADYDFVYRCHCRGVLFQPLGDVVVNMQLGGLAGRSRVVARRETYDIACRHARLPLLPWFAFAARMVLGR
ncbi:MAG: glycosyltransferase [Lentisphaerae bacterium]|jgi:glycosyltransferase involved in cell wall biosynthesis|nr:glycosyltransferase [Lentisphaerota bacterium]MBT4815922.1 glycosyltransferase [Lentisphaerota bacterium]MBT5611604.1 glycosyltransferase [Lentisphaerota bacterium]MBT7061703.1 glycosyltransferase [Lentisphaerota bacterium]MBT7846549.1 glycosyltransferase [Lentisphaerota bacterium]